MIIYDGDQVGFSFFSINLHRGPMHDIALPQIVWQLGFKFAAINRIFLGKLHHVLLVQKPVNRGVVELHLRVGLPHLLN